jgi:hypothetical protein
MEVVEAALRNNFKDDWAVLCRESLVRRSKEADHSLHRGNYHMLEERDQGILLLTCKRK